METLRQLQLEYHQRTKAKADLTKDQIEFLHTTKAFIIEVDHLVPPCHEALAPMEKRLGIMQPQHFDIGDDEGGPLDHRKEFR
jgi:hypothetical protein